MSFEKTNILDTPKTRQAYDFVTRRLERKLRPIVIKKTMREFQEEEYVLKYSSEMSEQARKTYLEKLQYSKEQFLAPNSHLFEQVMEQNVRHSIKPLVAHVKSFSYVTEGNAEDMVIVSLLGGVALSPMDYKDIKSQFGEDISALHDEVRNARAYQNECELDTLSKTARAVLLMDSIIEVREAITQVEQLAPGQQLLIYPREFLTKLKEVEPLFGRNSQLDTLFEDDFNALHTKYGSGMSLSIADGQANLDTNGKVKGLMVIEASGFDDPRAFGSKDPKPPKDGPKPNGPKKGGNGDIKLF